MTENARFAAALARLEESQKHQDETITRVLREVSEMRREVAEVRQTASRWKGAFIVILSLGGLAGWVLERVMGFHQ